MKEFKQLGAYGLIVKDDKILLIRKFRGPYDGKLDLPGGTIEFGEKPAQTLKRELKEETGIEILNYELFDANSVTFKWAYKENILLKVHHIGIFYKVLDYKNKIKKEVNINNINDDSLGANWYHISKLNKNELSLIVILELEKLGYNIN